MPRINDRTARLAVLEEAQIKMSGLRRSANLDGRGDEHGGRGDGLERRGGGDVA